MNTPTHNSMTHIASAAAPLSANLETNACCASNKTPLSPIVVGYARVSTDLQREKGEHPHPRSSASKRECLRLVVGGWARSTATTASVARFRSKRVRRAPVCWLDARAGKVSKLWWFTRQTASGRDVLVNEMAARATARRAGRRACMAWPKASSWARPIGRAMFTFQSAIGKLERENTLRPLARRHAPLGQGGHLARRHCALRLPRGKCKDRAARLSAFDRSGRAQRAERSRGDANWFTGGRATRASLVSRSLNG